jgi:hypothetical protein
MVVGSQPLRVVLAARALEFLQRGLDAAVILGQQSEAMDFGHVALRGSPLVGEHLG